MESKDSAQYSNPENKPKGISQDPKATGEESEDIRKGAKDESQIEKLQPKDENDRATNDIGSPPTAKVDNGDAQS